MEKEFARLMMLLIKATKGKGYQLFMNFAQKGRQLERKDTLSVEIGGKYYKSKGKPLHDMTDEVIWRIKNSQPSQ